MSKTKFSVLDDKKTLVVERKFEAPLKKLWSALTTQEQLEKWWAPLPWNAETKSFDFREGG